MDNLPPQMLSTLADLVARTPETLPKLAVVIDVRGKALFNDMPGTLAALENSGVEFSVLFLDASDEVLVSRYEHQRRPHPLQAGGRILDGIKAERSLLQDLRESSDSVLDTSSFSVRLTRAVADMFSTNGPVVLRLTVMSFGFKYGVPADANFDSGRPVHPQPALGACPASAHRQGPRGAGLRVRSFRHGHVRRSIHLHARAGVCRLSHRRTSTTRPLRLVAQEVSTVPSRSPKSRSS